MHSLRYPRLLLAPLQRAERGRISPCMTAHMLREPLRSHGEQVPQPLSWAVPTQQKTMAAVCRKFWPLYWHLALLPQPIPWGYPYSSVRNPLSFHGNLLP